MLLTPKMRIPFLLAIVCWSFLWSKPAVAAGKFVVDSVATKQLTDSMFAGQTDAKIIAFMVYLSGISSNDTVYAKDFSFNLKAKKTAEILRARLFATAQTYVPTQALAVQAFAAKDHPGAALLLTDSVALQNGLNCFVLCFDISSKVQFGAWFDAELRSLKVGRKNINPAKGNPKGERYVAAKPWNLSCPVTKTSLSNYQVGPTKVQINQFTHYSTNDSIQSIIKKPINILKNDSLHVTVRAGSFFDETIHIWIDWNGDGYWTESEKVFTSARLNASETTSTTLVSPCGVAAGLKKMRIIGEYYSYSISDPCASLAYGSAEDYYLWLRAEDSLKATFSTDTLVYDHDLANLNNLSFSSYKNTKYLWDLNHDGVFDTSCFNLNYIPKITGKNIITMQALAESCDNSTVITRQFSDSFITSPITQKPVAHFIADKNYLMPGEKVALFDNSENGVESRKWVILPEIVDGKKCFEYLSGSAENARPIISFSQTGKYTLALLVKNKMGEDKLCEVNYFEVATPYTKHQSSSYLSDTLRDNFGIIYDGGGATGSYENNDFQNVVIKPRCGGQLQLELNFIDLNAYHYGTNPGDLLKIYDGINSTDSAVHAKYGYNGGFTSLDGLPLSPGNYLTKSGKAKIEFTSDAVAQADGYEITYTVLPFNTKKPQIKIIAPDTVFLHSSANISCDNGDKFVSTIWDFNNDGIPDAVGKAVAYAWHKTGLQQVRLITKQCGRQDTFIKNVLVVKPLTAPKARFAAIYRTIELRDTAFIMNKSKNGPTQFKWKTDRQTAVNFVDNSSDTSKDIALAFDSLGFYGIKLSCRNALGGDSLTIKKYIRVRNFCIPSVVSSLGDLGISSFSLYDAEGNQLITQKSDENAGYTNFAYSKKATLTKGEKYIVKIERKTTNYPMQRAVWIDMDGDGNFDPNEMILSEPSSKTKIYIDSFVLDTACANGLSRIRIGTNTAGKTDYGCGPHLSGEFEDYGLIITKDKEAPQLKLMGADTLYLEKCRPYREYGATAVDNVDGKLDKKILINGKVTVDSPGTYLLQYTVADSNGNVAKANRIIIVTPDSTQPAIQLKGKKYDTVAVFKTYTDPGFAANDSCSGIVASYSKSYVNTSKTNTYPIYYTTIDGAGNKDSIRRWVTVVDTTAPLFSFSPDKDSVYTEVNESYIDSAWRVSDNYDKSPKVIITGIVNTEALDTFQLSYTAIDSAGNSSKTANRVVIVRDSKAPLLLLPLHKLEVEVGNKIKLPEPWIKDNFDINPLLQIIGTYNTNKTGNYTIQFVASDFSGNISDTALLEIKVVDLTKPNVKLIKAPFITHCRWQSFFDPGIIATDNYNDSTELAVSVEYVNSSEQPIDTAQMVQSEGYYTAIYTATDQAGNSSKIVRTIHIMHCETGMNDFNTTDLQIYPNPSRGLFYIKSKADLLTYQVFNSTGELVATGRNATINLTSFADGLYYVKVYTKNAQSFTKIIKQ
ncbi:DUF5011 domain-containing protein [bacterium]|nr:DUF5011 domain-containing protein [bacterium]